MFSIGTKVVMSEVGKVEYGNHRDNPHDEVGVIHEYGDEDDFVYFVGWEGGGNNDYRIEDLDLHRPTLPNIPLENYL